MSNIQNRFDEIEKDVKEIKHRLNEQKMTEEDITLIVDRVCEKIETRIYQDVGHGVVKFAWRGLILIIIAVAAYGAGVKNFF